MERRYGTGLIRSLAEGHRRRCAVARSHVSLAQGGWELASARARSRSAPEEHSRWCRALRVSASSVETRGAAAGLLDPGRGDRVETLASGVLEKIGRRSGSVRSHQHRRGVGLSTVRVGYLPRWTAEAARFRSGGRRRPQRELPRDKSSGADGCVVRRLRPISCGRRGSCPDVYGLESQETLAPIGGLLLGPRSVEVDAVRRETSERSRAFVGLRSEGRVRRDGTPHQRRDGRFTQERWQHRECTRPRFAALFFRFFTWTLSGRD